MARLPENEVKNPDAVAKIVDVSEAAPADVAALLAKVADLERQLGIERTARTAAEEARFQQAMLQTGSNQQAVPSGKTIKVQRIRKDEATGMGIYETVGYKDDGRPILKPKFEQIEVPTYFLRIDLPAIGGMDLKINGLSLIHNSLCEFDEDTLRSVQEMIARTWAHEASIHGDDENKFRAPQAPTLRGGGAVRTGR